MHPVIRAACHIHSDWSYDGSWSLERLAASFGRRGYGALLLTEHDKGFSEARRMEHREACRKASTGGMLVIPGIEYSDAANVVHILVWGDIPFLGEGTPTIQLLTAVQEQRGVAVLAHPSRRQAWMQVQPSWFKSLDGIEAWNRKADGWAPSRAGACLLGRSGLLPFVGLDFHTRRQFFPLSMQVPIEGIPTEDAVIEEIRNGSCRAYAMGRSLEDKALRIGQPLLAALERMRRSGSRMIRRASSITTRRGAAKFGR